MKLIDEIKVVIAWVSILLNSVSLYCAYLESNYIWLLTGLTVYVWIGIWFKQLIETWSNEYIINEKERELKGYDLKTHC